MGSQPKGAAVAPRQDGEQECYTLTVAITPSVVKALLWWRKKQFNTATKPGDVAKWVLMLALQRPELVKQWLLQLANYCSAEDVSQREFLNASVAKIKAIRRVKIPSLN